MEQCKAETKGPSKPARLTGRITLQINDMKLLTIDVEEWFHVLGKGSCGTEKDWDNYPKRLEEGAYRILDLLNERGVKCTFFCVGWVANKYPGLIKRMEKEGHQVGSHTYMHRLATGQTRKEFTADLKRSLSCLSQITGRKVTCFRAPGFSINTTNLWVLEVLLEQGIEIDSSLVGASLHSYSGLRKANFSEPFLINVGGASLKEFPVSLTSIFNRKMIFSGGGYFRLFPYRWIREWTRRSEYTMTYFHCHDFDVNQPPARDAGLLHRMKRAYGLRRAFRKFERYLDDFPFANIEHIDRKTEWARRQQISLEHLATL